MRLKRVRIYGFKTFADRTEFDLEGGLVAVVGSNGCGKSNIVDAILWGLGESNSRHLRAQSGQEVIFNGSAARKPIGFAEVSLIFDNEDGSLPLPSAEVMITRRITRAGESEYKINNCACRQRDVYELLADSGLGRAGYAIVGQREIDGALSASAEDRRSWIDEAAGVQRYRQRRQEAERRLTAARDHMERTQDILAELDYQREPLREEAELARTYKDKLSTFRSIERSLLLSDFYKAKSEIHQIQERLSENRRLTESEAQRKLDWQKQLEIAQAENLEADRTFEILRDRESQESSYIERLEGLIGVQVQKLIGLAQLAEGISVDGDAERLRLEAAEHEHEEAIAEVKQAEQALADLKSSASNGGEELGSASALLSVLDAELVEAKAEDARLMKVGAEKAHNLERAKEIRRELVGIESGEKDLVEAVEEAVAAEVTEAENLRNALAEVKTIEEDARRHETKLMGLGDSLRVALAKKSALEGRLQGIKATIESHEGLAAGPKAVLDAAKNGTLAGEFVPVAEAIDVPVEYATAIEIALGASSSDLIVETDSAAKAAIEYLKTDRLGRATFQPLNMVKGGQPSSELIEFCRQPGVVGRAAQLISFKSRYDGVIESLLGRIVIVDNLETALQLAKRTHSRPFSRLVTLGGEVVLAAGAVMGGAVSRIAMGAIHRGAEVRRLEEEMTSVQAECDRLEEFQRGSGKSRDALHGKLAQARERSSKVETAWREARSFASALKEENDAAQKSKSRLSRELESLSGSLETSRKGRPLEEIEREREDCIRRLAAGAADQEGFKKLLEDCERRLAIAEKNYESAARRREAILANQAARNAKIENLGPETEGVESEIQRLRGEVESASAKLEATRSSLVLASDLKKRSAEALGELAGEISRSQDTVELLTAALHRIELDRARAESRQAQAAEKLVEEYDLSELALAQGVDYEEAPDDAAPIAAKLKRELREMGEVNLGAIEAFDRLSQRYQELDAQMSDLLSGIDEVEKAIIVLDSQTKDKFSTTLNQLQSHFSVFVKRLFGGGEGFFELSDPADVLNSGVDIVVTPPGKKRQSLGLLSGGERSLCAAAFLFALLSVKSSPLVVLDEIDAPLDGVNVERFASALSELSSRMQFLVITHNPTTIAAAPMWLGVTMKEPGCSVLVPYHGDLRTTKNTGLAVVDDLAAKVTNSV